jgi:hypothetical protein
MGGMGMGCAKGEGSMKGEVVLEGEVVVSGVSGGSGSEMIGVGFSVSVKVVSGKAMGSGDGVFVFCKR